MPEEYEPVPENTTATIEPIFTEDELMNLRSIKLMNGDNILACILAIDENKLIIKRPCQKIVFMGEDNSTKLLLTKWQSHALNENHTIMAHAIVGYCMVTLDMIEFYIKSVQQQIIDECKQKEPVSPFPSWMDLPLNKSQIN
jgi:hypothetical protein